MTREFSTARYKHEQADATAPEPTREELLGLLDFYSSEAAPQPLDTTAQPVSEDDEILINALHTLQAESDHIQPIITKLQGLLNDPLTPHTALMTVYSQLPSPGASRLTDKILLKFLNRLSTVPRKSETTMWRFMNLITDMRAAGKHVPLSAWTSAISFAGRHVKRISAAEVESALELWKQMETEAGIRANEVTFNVLFDIAAKARKFVLADMVLHEMHARGHRLTRYTRTSLMYYHGLRGDGGGVRRAYRELVEAGEIVDTTVMSAAVASLLNAGEPVAAEQIFERAKQLHAEKGGARPLPPHSWRERRELGRSLQRASARWRNDAEQLKAAQRSAPLAPGAQVYKALVYHHAVQAGDIERVSALVDEMAWYNIPVQGAIFLYLFKGFDIHGGVLYSSWTRQRLETTLTAFLGAVEASHDEHRRSISDNATSPNGFEEATLQEFTRASSDEEASHPSEDSPLSGMTRDEHVYISRAAAEFCLSAFVRVVNTERAEEVWSQLQLLWTPNASERDAIEALLVRLEARKNHDAVWGSAARRGRRAKTGLLG